MGWHFNTNTEGTLVVLLDLLMWGPFAENQQTQHGQRYWFDLRCHHLRLVIIAIVTTIITFIIMAISVIQITKVSDSVASVVDIMAHEVRYLRKKGTVNDEMSHKISWVCNHHFGYR